MSARIPVLVLTPWPSFWEGAPGVGCSDEDEVHRGLAAAGFDVHYVMPRARGAEPPVAPSHLTTGPHVLRWAGILPSGLRRPVRYWAYQGVYPGLGTRAGRKVRPRIVVGHSYVAARAAVRVARALGARSVTKFFGVMTLARADQPEWLHRARHWEMIDAFRAGADRVVVFDDGTHGDQAALRYGVPPERLRFWPNGLDTSFRTRAPGRPREELRARAGAGPDEMLVLMVNRLVDNKRVDVALSAAAELARPGRGVRFRLALVGEGPLRSPLEAQVRELGLGPRVTFLGAQTHDQTFEWLHAADVFLGTSALTNRSLTTLEAMMCGLPVVATDAGDTRGLLRDGVDSLLAPAEPEVLAGALARLARDPALRRALGAAAREASESFPGWPERVAREVALYHELLGER